jgi:hypothetical protein
MKFLIFTFLFLFVTCNKQHNKTTTDCGNAYEFQDASFNKDLTLYANIKFFFLKDSLAKDDSILVKNALLLLNKQMEITNKQFKLDTIEFIGSRYKDQMVSFRSLARNYNKENSFNVYVYDSIQPDYSGDRRNIRAEAADIPSKTIAIRYQFLNTSTLTHEILHCVGLYHIHQPDPTDGYNVDYGDLVCDTRSIVDVTEYVDGDCNYIGPSDPKSDTTHYECNIMTYIKESCRSCITDGQIRRINRIIHDSEDLRKIFGIKTDNL